MMTPPYPEVTNRALAILLAGTHQTEREMAAAAGLRPGTISSYVSGWKKLSRKTLLRISRNAGFAPATVEDALALAGCLGPDSVQPAGAPDLVAELGRLAERLAAERLPQILQEAVPWEERRRFRELWAEKKDFAAKDWKALVTQSPELVRWGLCERLAEESAEAASDDADRALELAGLALWVAERVPTADNPLLCQGYALGFVGNARRVKGQLDESVKAFTLSARLWQERADGDPGFLDGARLLDLEASLKIEQHRFPEALRLLDQAAAQVRGRRSLGCILIKNAYALELMGDYAGAVARLERAAALIDETDVRLCCVLRFNLMVNLCHLGRANEAAPMLKDLRALAVQIGKALDQVRLRWLAGKIDAGQGRTEKAIEVLSSVRADFSERGIRYDEALVSLELAGLYLEAGRTGDVKRLVRLMATVFQDEGVHAEAQKALELFRRAVELETVTLELVRRLVAYLYRAQHDPSLQFEAG
jgi:tetratricopeptide (TPR) repeat protein